MLRPIYVFRITQILENVWLINFATAIIKFNGIHVLLLYIFFKCIFLRRVRRNTRIFHVISELKSIIWMKPISSELHKRVLMHHTTLFEINSIRNMSFGSRGLCGLLGRIRHYSQHCNTHPSLDAAAVGAVLFLFQYCHRTL